MAKYGLYETYKNAVSFIITKVFFRRARLIRYPFYVRNKKSIFWGRGLTTGYFCRFECIGNGKKMIFGDDVRIGDRVHIVASDHVRIGNDCLLASNIFISDCDHGDYSTENDRDIFIHPKDRPLYSKRVEIGNDCWIGENVCVLKGAKIGNNCIIGSNSIVNSEIPDFSIAVGQPARVIKWFNTKTMKWERVVK